MRSAQQLARAIAGVALLVYSASCTMMSHASANDSPSGRPYVVLVSLDAFRADYIDRYHPRAIEALAARGVRAEAMIPAFPSKTFPNHYSIVTGLYPGEHGIVGNTFYDPATHAAYRNSDPKAANDSSWYSGTPIWVAAEKEGVKTGIYFWPGSEAAIQGVRPSYFAAYSGKVPNVERVHSVTEWLRKPPVDRPHFVAMYVSEVDDTTHHYGPDAPATALAVADVDAVVGQLIDSLHTLPFADSIDVVIVSDHGMAQTSPMRLLPISDALLRNQIDTAGILYSDNGPAVSLYIGTDLARVRRIQTVINSELVHSHAYLRQEAPARWHVSDNPKYGDLIVVAETGWTVQKKSTDKAPNAGAHGYDPVEPLMRAIFVAAGPDVKPVGRIPAFENVRVYSFLAAMLQLHDVSRAAGGICGQVGANC